MATLGQPPLAAYLPLTAGQNLADLPNPAQALINLGTLGTSDIMTNSVPLGTIIAFWGNTAPVGYLPCFGQTVNSATYPSLVSFLGGTTSAVLPELRGEFLRGWDSGRGIDSGRLISTLQLDALQNITGSYAAVNNTAIGQSFLGAFSGTGSFAFPVPTGGTTVSGNNVSFDASRVARTSTETRPRNVSVLYCIKAYGAIVNTTTANMAGALSQLSTATQLSQFGVALSSNGYQKLPSGLIIQWVNIGPIALTAGTFSSTVITWPIAFTTTILATSSTLTLGNLTNSFVNTSVEGRSFTGATVVQGCGVANPSVSTCILAIGY